MSTTQTAVTPDPEKLWVAALIGAKMPAKKPEDPLKDLDVDDIRDSLTFSLKTVPQGALDHLKALVGNDSMTSLDKKGNAMKEIDTQEDARKLKALDSDTGKKVGAALKKITAIKDKALKEKFEAAGYTGAELERFQTALEAHQKGEELPKNAPTAKEIEEFGKLADKIDGEISDEVFTPLVRQGAMPENLVPDRFSNMKRTFEGAKKGYEERLQKYTEEAGQNSELVRKLGISQNMIDKASSLGSAVLKALPSDVGGDIVEHVNTAVELLPLATGMVIETAQQLAQKKDPQDIVNSILGNVGNICGTVIGGEGGDKDLADIVSGSITAAIAGGKVVRSIIDKKPEAAFQALAAAVSSALSTAGTATGNDELKELAPVVIKGILTCAAAKKYRDALKKGDPTKIKEALAELLESSIETIAEASKGTVNLTVEDEEEAEGYNELIESAAEAAKEAEEALLGDEEQEDEEISDEDKANIRELQNIVKAQNEIIAKEKDPEKKREACKKKAEAMLELQENRNMLKRLKDAENPEFLDINEDDMDGDDDITPPQKLQELILQMQKEQKIFKLINTLSSLPLQVAAQFFPPAGAGLSFKQFAVEAMIAVKHARALLVWQDNAKNAKWGASPQVHAMMSRVGMSERRATEHSINAALHLTAGIGSIVTTAGAHGAPVGVAMTAGAKVGLAAAALAKVAIDEAQMEKGWRLFQAALKDPKNRKAARRAIESNPTLAKYSLAWGAVHGGDVFAKDALKKCGITPRILETEGAKVSEVQRYLEVMFDEDLIILRAVPDKKDWYPASKPALTFVSWTMFLGAATTKAKPPLAKGSGGAVSEAFVNYNTAEKEFKKATKAYNTAKAEMEKIVATEMGKLPKQDPNGKKPVTAPKTAAEIQKEAREKSKIDDAKKALDESSKALKGAIESIQSAANGFNPVNETDKKEHEQMREYLDALVALSDLKLKELGGETVALDMKEDVEEVEGEDEEE